MGNTKTISSPVIAKETTAAGPAALMTTPLPTNSPAPMTPPKAIIIMCLCFNVCCSSPVAADSHVAQRLADGGHRIAQYARADGADAADSKGLDRGQFAWIQDEAAFSNPPVKF